MPRCSASPRFLTSRQRLADDPFEGVPCRKAFVDPAILDPAQGSGDRRALGQAALEPLWAGLRFDRRFDRGQVLHSDISQAGG